MKRKDRRATKPGQEFAKQVQERETAARESDDEAVIAHFLHAHAHLFTDDENDD